MSELRLSRAVSRLGMSLNVSCSKNLVGAPSSTCSLTFYESRNLSSSPRFDHFGFQNNTASFGFTGFESIKDIWNLLVFQNLPCLRFRRPMTKQNDLLFHFL
jgi:hypothetical protein